MTKPGKRATKASLIAIAVTAAGLLGGVRTASAQSTFKFDATGSSNPAAPSITGLGFAPGNALVVNALPGGTPIHVGETFQVYFQTHLTSLNGAATPPGLNSTFQITEVATLTETVTSVTTPVAGSTSVQATFGLNTSPFANNRIMIYDNPGAVTFNDAAGTGFTTGNVIAILTPTTFPVPSTFTVTLDGASPTPAPVLVPFNGFGIGNTSPTNSVEGSGTTLITSTVNFLNPAFFQPPAGVPLLVTSAFNAGQSLPFDAVPPSSKFTDPTGAIPLPFSPNDGTTNGVSGPDLQFQVNGITNGFAVVPEPASVTLMGLGVVGALVVVRRQRNKVA